ncbi:hypothetical protein [Flavobacterium daejeonense]|uniref:hypothetical protein n=1 Tax=Flavobacterium daejeonense TaxID=350893 RepID=UPI00047CE431|nr:hypothetical protein [Flavobacterium daejeonense]
MKKIFALVWIIFFQLLFSCHYQHHELKIVNNSNEIVYYETYFHKDLDKYDVYNKYQKVYYLEDYKVLNPKDSIRPANQSAWSYDIETISKDSTLTVAFFSRAAVKKYGWDKIILLKKYKTYTYNIKQLDSMNWVVEHKEK